MGIYFFSYLMTSQFIEVLAMNLNQVMFPVMSLVSDQPERQSRALERTLRMLVLVAAPTSLVLAATIRPLEVVLWNEKWAAAVPLMQVFAVTAPLRMFSDVMLAALSGRGQFRGGALLTLAEGLWSMVLSWVIVTVVGCEPSDLTFVATLIAVSHVSFSVVSSLLISRTFAISPGSFLAAILPAWLASLAAAAAAAGTAAMLVESFGPLVTFLTGVVVFGVAFTVIARDVLAQRSG